MNRIKNHDIERKTKESASMIAKKHDKNFTDTDIKNLNEALGVPPEPKRIMLIFNQPRKDFSSIKESDKK